MRSHKKGGGKTDREEYMNGIVHEQINVSLSYLALL